MIPVQDTPNGQLRVVKHSVCCERKGYNKGHGLTRIGIPGRQLGLSAMEEVEEHTIFELLQVVQFSLARKKPVGYHIVGPAQERVEVDKIKVQRLRGYFHPLMRVSPLAHDIRPPRGRSVGNLDGSFSYREQVLHIPGTCLGCAPSI